MKVDGQTLSIAAVTAAARCNTPVTLDQSSHIKSRVAQSRSVIAEKVESGISVYGLSTGFGGSGVLFELLYPSHSQCLYSI